MQQNMHPPNEWNMDEDDPNKVLGWNFDAWNIGHFVEADPDVLAHHPLNKKRARIVAEGIAEGRCAVRNCYDKSAVTEATSAAEKALHAAHANESEKRGKVGDWILIGRAVEAFDIAYGLAWMRNRGVDIDDHPELRSYQTYYEAGMRPPSHEQMALYAIKQYGLDQRTTKEILDGVLPPDPVRGSRAT